MKIGTVTYWNTQDNYGQILQCYALLKVLRNMGHNAYLIKYVTSPRKKNLAALIITAAKYILSPSYRRTALMWKRLRRISAEEAAKHPRGFDQFRAEHIPSTDRTYNKEELKSIYPDADAYVCGSDQIWGHPDLGYFLHFGTKTTKRIAYAPSMGGIIPNKKCQKELISYLSDFDFISSREKSDVHTLHKLGFTHAIQQPDPTLLLPAVHYLQLATPHVPPKPYLLLYLLGNETDVKTEEIYAFAHKNDLPVRYVASQGRVDQFPKLYPTVGEWLSLINDASYVITNSFHGTIFCLQFNTPFITLPVNKNIDRMNNRIYDLLEKYDLKDRIFAGRLDKLFDTINFDVFNRKRNQEAQIVKKNFEQILAR